MQFRFDVRVCRALRALWSLSLLIALAGCGGTNSPPWTFADLMSKTKGEAVANLLPKNGSAVTGDVTFVQRGDKVAVVALVHNLASGSHSLYIHETGNCSSPNAASAGRVWQLSGAPPGRTRAGNLPEMVARTEGDASLSVELRGITVGDGSPLDVIGHAVVVHSGIDPDPRPEFGVRNGWLACGVIERK